MTKILAHYKHIIQCVRSVYEGFEEYKPLTGQRWVSYINKMDAVIEEALKQCVRGSLQIMLEAVHGDGLAGPRQMLKVSTTFKNNTVSKKKFNLNV
ncbi:Dynein heavy chain 2, axonemal [Zootermopsis nevadensis]|uniref:Dynein heavy chain 2, axonemal n=1 Tax=Zootermopsis nevadensis TaxID=136037 RepID=A0A067QUD8_ZOONE|nr:Dynein heavy chain 2, axonemal [Zootermopsis nevadensis]